jgi:hypothetical protein
MPNNRYVLKKEKAMTNALYKEFKQQKKELINILKTE